MLKIRREKDEKIIEYYKDIPIDFKRDGFLMRRKIAEYLPVMTITKFHETSCSYAFPDILL